jgi:hypothetical protein
MKTRTLLLLSVACGLMILLAGGVKLFQVATDRTDVEVLSLGEAAMVGDMDVTVMSIENTDSGVVAVVEMSGVAGAEVLDGWSMLGDGELSDPSGAVADGGGVIRCSLRFPAVDAEQYVAYQRGGELRRWAP